MQSVIFCDQLSADLYWNRAFEQMWLANHSDRFVSTRAVCDYQSKIFQN